MPKFNKFIALALVTGALALCVAPAEAHGPRFSSRSRSNVVVVQGRSHHVGAAVVVQQRPAVVVQNRGIFGRRSTVIVGR